MRNVGATGMGSLCPEDAAMLRITQVREDGDTIHLKVEGRVIGDGVSELDRTCEDRLSRNQRIILDMSDVTYIDRQGVDALKRILGNNVQLTDATLLLQALLG